MNELGVTESCKILEAVKLLIRQLSEKENKTEQEIIKLRDEDAPAELIHFYTGINAQVRHDIRHLSRIVKDNT